MYMNIKLILFIYLFFYIKIIHIYYLQSIYNLKRLSPYSKILFCTCGTASTFPCDLNTLLGAA